MSGGYDPGFYPELFAAEDRHFWFRARNETISRIAARILGRLGKKCRVLEIGCGDGNVLRFLEKSGEDATFFGMDYLLEGLLFARRRCGCPLVQGDLTQPPFGRAFQLIGMFDVLEHLDEDRRVLRHCHEMLQKGGALILTVPAHQSLWSDFDQISGHCRRYERAELSQKLVEAGYRIEFLTEYMTSIYPLLWFSRRRLNAKPRRGAADVIKQQLRIVPVLNNLLYFAAAAEARWISGYRRLPFGASLLAVATKSDTLPLEE